MVNEGWESGQGGGGRGGGGGVGRSSERTVKLLMRFWYTEKLSQCMHKQPRNNSMGKQHVCNT